MGELWDLLVSAQESVTGIPEAFLQQKKDQIKKRLVIIKFLLYNSTRIKELFVFIYITHIKYGYLVFYNITYNFFGHVFELIYVWIY